MCEARWDEYASEAEPAIANRSWVQAIAPLDHSSFITGGADGRMRLWNVRRTSSPPMHLTAVHCVEPAVRGAIGAVAAVPEKGEGSWLVLTNSPNAAQLWRLRINSTADTDDFDGGGFTPVGPANLVRGGASVRAIAMWVTADGRPFALVAMADPQKNLELWDLRKVRGDPKSTGGGDEESSRWGLVGNDEDSEDELPPPPVVVLQRCESRSSDRGGDGDASGNNNGDCGGGGDDDDSYLVRSYIGGHHTETVTCVAVASLPREQREQHRLAISGGGDRNVCVWEIEEARAAGGAGGEAEQHPIATLTGHSGAVRCCSIFRHDTRAATGSDDRTVIVWRFPAGDDATDGGGGERAGALFPQLYRLEGHGGDVLCVAALRCDTALICGNRGGTLKLWHLPYHHRCRSGGAAAAAAAGAGGGAGGGGSKLPAPKPRRRGRSKSPYRKLDAVRSRSRSKPRA